MSAYVRMERGLESLMHGINASDSPSFGGILSGTCKGICWVPEDGPSNIAVVHSHCVDSFSILGKGDKNALSKLKDFLTGQLFQKLSENGMGTFEFSVEDKDMEDALLSLFSDKKIESEMEYSYRTEEKNITCSEVSEGYCLCKVDHTFIEELEAGQFEQIEILTDKILNSWYGYSEFLHNSLAYVILKDKRIVAAIVGTARYQNYIPIDIETEKTCRRQGLAKILTAHFIKECLGMGCVPQWDCVESNPVSQHTADMCGFTLFRERPVYWFSIA